MWPSESLAPPRHQHHDDTWHHDRPSPLAKWYCLRRRRSGRLKLIRPGPFDKAACLKGKPTLNLPVTARGATTTSSASASNSRARSSLLSLPLPVAWDHHDATSSAVTATGRVTDRHKQRLAADETLGAILRRARRPPSQRRCHRPRRSLPVLVGAKPFLCQ